MEKFYEPVADKKTTIQALKDLDAWYCIKDYDQIHLSGTSSTSPTMEIAGILIVPCQSPYGHPDPNIKCEKNESELWEYINPLYQFKI